jgi:hypothetical protein
MGASGRRILAALAQGETDSTRLAELALGRLRLKIPQLIPALEGHFRPHQLSLLRELLNQYEELCARLERFEQEMEIYARPFEEAVARLAVFSHTGFSKKPADLA